MDTKAMFQDRYSSYQKQWLICKKHIDIATDWLSTIITSYNKCNSLDAKLFTFPSKEESQNSSMKFHGMISSMIDVLDSGSLKILHEQAYELYFRKTLHEDKIVEQKHKGLITLHDSIITNLSKLEHEFQDTIQQWPQNSNTKTPSRVSITQLNAAIDRTKNTQNFLRNVSIQIAQLLKESQEVLDIVITKHWKNYTKLQGTQKLFDPCLECADSTNICQKTIKTLLYWGFLITFVFLLFTHLLKS